MSEIIGNVVNDAGKSHPELLKEITQLRKELIGLGRTDIGVTDKNEYDRPVPELLDIVFKLRNELMRAKRSKSVSKQSKSKEPETRKKRFAFGAGTARNALIYSEILGKPLSKRR